MPALRVHPLDPALARVVRNAMKVTGTPGVAVGILDRGRAYAGGFGITSVDAPVPVDEHTLFQIGSTTKTFTASAAMRYVERGRLDLDAPVRRYLPAFRLRDRETERAVTLRHIFTHTGGWFGDHFADTGRGDDALERMVRSLATLRQMTPLGAVWHYNNAGFYIAGRVLERVAGKPYEDIIRELFFEPLGMDHSFFFAEDVISRRHVVGHVARRSGHVVCRPWALPRGVNPAGAITSCVVDQLRWAMLHMGDGRAADGKRVLRASTVKAMQREHSDAANMAEHVGISWLLRDAGGVRLVEHGGTTEGQLSSFTMVPSHRFAITVLTNSTRGREVYNAAIRWALRSTLGLDLSPPVPIEVDRLGDYTGLYAPAKGDWRIRLDARAGALVLRYLPPPDSSPKDLEGWIPAPTRLRFYEPDRVFVADGQLAGARYDFLRGARGRVRWLRLGGRLYRKVPAR